MAKQQKLADKEKRRELAKKKRAESKAKVLEEKRTQGNKNQFFLKAPLLPLSL